VLKLAGPLPLASTESADAEDILRRTMDDERERLRGRDDDTDDLYGLPGYDAHTKAVRKRLSLLAPPDDSAGSDGPPAAETEATGGRSGRVAAG
jgi:hypothetical protein